MQSGNASDSFRLTANRKSKSFDSTAPSISRVVCGNISMYRDASVLAPELGFYGIRVSLRGRVIVRPAQVVPSGWPYVKRFIDKYIPVEARRDGVSIPLVIPKHSSTIAASVCVSCPTEDELRVAHP